MAIVILKFHSVPSLKNCMLKIELGIPNIVGSVSLNYSKSITLKTDIFNLASKKKKKTV
jgi:hypothetical protein